MTDMELVERILIAAQKARSNMMEMELGEEHLAVISPWLFGDSTIMRALEQIIEAGEVKPTELFNILTICEMEPSIVLVYGFRFEEPLPEAMPYLTEALAR